MIHKDIKVGDWMLPIVNNLARGLKDTIQGLLQNKGYCKDFCKISFLICSYEKETLSKSVST